MENENRDAQMDDAQATEDLELSSEDAEGIAGGKKKLSSDPDAGAQRA